MPGTTGCHPEVSGAGCCGGLGLALVWGIGSGVPCLRGAEGGTQLVPSGLGETL